MLMLQGGWGIAGRIVRLVDSGRTTDRGRLVDRLIAGAYHFAPAATYDMLIGPLMRRSVLSRRRTSDGRGNLFASLHASDSDSGP